MEALTVLPQDAEQKRTIEAFLNALKINYLRTEPTLEELEARLLPGQLKVWTGLKTAIQEVNNGTAKGRTWAEFKKEWQDGNTLTPTV